MSKEHVPLKLFNDMEEPINSIESLYEVLDKRFTSNTAVAIDTPRGCQFGTIVAVDEQAALEGVSGSIKASLIATRATSVICHVPIGIPSLEAKKDRHHWNWTVACHLEPGVIKRHILAEAVSNSESGEFKTTILQELDQDSGFEDLSFLPIVFRDLASFLCEDNPHEITRARNFLEETRPNLEWNWSDYDH